MSRQLYFVQADRKDLTLLIIVNGLEADPSAALSRNSLSNSLCWNELQVESGCLFLQPFHLMATVFCFVVFGAFVGRRRCRISAGSYTDLSQMKLACSARLRIAKKYSPTGSSPLTPMQRNCRQITDRKKPEPGIHQRWNYVFVQLLL